MSNNWVVFILLVLTVLSCKKEKSTLFSLVNPEISNVDFRNDLKEGVDFNILNYIYYYNGGGVSIGDINGDGFPELFFTSNEGPNKLYLNKGGMIFEDISEAAGIPDVVHWSTGSSMVDLNGDGLLDIYVCNLGGGYQGKVGKNQLFINQGNGTFIEQAEAYGLDFSGYATQATFLDYDNDDDLDVFLLNHSVHTDRSYGDREKLLNYNSKHSGDRLLRNDSESGNPIFKDVTEYAKINNSSIGYGLGVSTSDINNDGFVDIYVSNDFHENDYLYINNGDGTFEESGQELLAHTSRYSMGNDIADINNDGAPDIITLDMLPDDMAIFQRSTVEDSYDLRNLKLNFGYGHQVVRNTLQMNMGDGTFEDIAPLAGVDATDWSWGPLLSDFDNDGFKDLFITNGIYRRPNDLDYINYYSDQNVQRSIANGINANNLSLIDKMPTDKVRNYMFRNKGDLTFEDLTISWGLDQALFSNGTAYGDLDLDGDLDIVINNVNDIASIFRNNSNKDENKYLQVKLKGTEQNRFGIGAKILVKTANGTFVQEQSPVRGFQSSVDPVLTLGLGKKVNIIDSVMVVWPGGLYQTIKGVEVNSILEIDKGKAYGNYYRDKKKLKEPTLFEKVTDSLSLNVKHQENTFFDKNREILIPHSVSNEGPKIAFSDVNADGLEDMLIGGARRSPTKLFLQDKNGGWQYSPQFEIEKDSLAEDTEVLFVDVDNDGDMDLYVASGGNEYWGKNEWLKDRIYANDGQGNFTDSNFDFEGNYVNNSCVAMADYDNDGDLDLFVGGRTVPWNYGLSPKSYLLENDGKGNYTDVTTTQVKGLNNLGMVTDAVWADVNANGKLDLIVVGEWMPVTVFENRGNGLALATDSFGLSHTKGLWNTIIADDFDKDGDLDFVVGNYGLNSKLEASVENPLTLLIKDFDKNGKTEPIIAITKNSKLYPVATLNELTSQMPHLKKRFPSYAEYSGKTVPEIFTSTELKGAIKKTVNTMNSVYLENVEGKSFTVKKLPQETQFAPIYGMVSHDFDSDGNLDVLLGGNMFTVNPGLGRHDASHGWYLKGNGDGTFKVLYSGESGFRSEGELRDIEVYHTDKGQVRVAVARNNDNLQIFKLLD
ncbi:VCBS repeat-containing protein [Zobellia galactanivorans]|uniref:VCBS repeat-containing protein n=1 Tax=Zobellia galactanivorans (strain DSM 12802 / CCUG 47099 / CIP 106680 / NCIMB 13871 / Dsij) TaxID=63186 RepID=UPI0026E404E4|nr:VCBS repeat-containing protein [Zobellia galactanivorans]MDO6810480.1 VCBS repeat-containing protein [Zobellia galactanivorans]